jgi:hypothetical protein
MVSVPGRSRIINTPEHRDWDGNSPIIQMIEMVDILRYL